MPDLPNVFTELVEIHDPAKPGSSVKVSKRNFNPEIHIQYALPRPDRVMKLGFTLPAQITAFLEGDNTHAVLTNPVDGSIEEPVEDATEEVVQEKAQSKPRRKAKAKDTGNDPDPVK